MSSITVQRVRVFPLCIPLRRRVSHAGFERGETDPILVSVELADGTVGYGETLPRPYVTGETVACVMDAVAGVYGPALANFRPRSGPAGLPAFPEALEAVEALPWRDAANRLVPAARAAVELALLDAVLLRFDRTVDDVAAWMGLPGFGFPGSLKKIRFSGVLAARGITPTMRQLRLMYWGGLRAFKLKVGVAADRKRLSRVAAYLARPIERGRATLRVDANGAWSVEEAVEWLTAPAQCPLVCVEQPLPRGAEEQLRDLRARTNCRVMHDESLVTIEDARRLIDLGVADGFNIRIAKCGGLLPSLRLAALARRERVDIQLGCMVGETSVLSAAALRFLQVCPSVKWAEGCFGSFLLGGDLVSKGLRFGYGGRPPRLTGGGLGVRVDERQLQRFAAGQPMTLDL